MYSLFVPRANIVLKSEMRPLLCAVAFGRVVRADYPHGLQLGHQETVCGLEE